MADSKRQWQGRPAKNSSPPGASSPLPPTSAGGNPISFRTNVNRAKTKRWVEAKQYSYDGGDWGDEDGEDEEPQTAPQPPYAHHRTGSSSELSSRRLSGLAVGSDGSRASPSAEAQGSSGGGEQKAVPFIRPADIYKRMREERSPAESERPTEASQVSQQPSSTPAPAAASYGETLQPGAFSSSSTSNNTSMMGLPELKRMSAFGTDFLNGSGSNTQQEIHPASQESSLQHNSSQGSSQGFRSVVQQAFDVPETPNSTAGSVERSNSDGTSTVSPIMGNRGWYDDKTPTIYEDPAESNSPTAPAFKPGHRRDISLPDAANSPSNKPEVSDQILPASSYADVSTVSPSGQTADVDSSSKQPISSAERDFVAPLKVGSGFNAAGEGYRGDVPTIVPAGSMVDSPQDADNDRLQEEIIRSLSRPGSQEPEGSQVKGPEESIPNQYEKYWDNGQPQSGSNVDETPKALVSDSHPDWTSAHPLGSQDPYAAGQAPTEVAPPSSGTPTKPRMSRRFSWESASSNGQSTSAAPGGVTSPPPLSAALASQEPEPIISGDGPDSALRNLSGEAPLADGEVSDDEKAEKPSLSIIPPVPDGSPPQQIAGPVDGATLQRDPLLADVGTADIDESKLQGFREILTITIPGERIRAFNHTRDQFAAMNTGLNHWIDFTVHENPEHADLIQSGQGLSADIPRSSPTARRFPKLTSLGNLASRDDTTPASADHNRRPSGHIGTKGVEQRGKDLLHTAGAFSGKAGEAAKGLFAKGRSKFRPSGDKVSSMSSRRSSSFQFSFPSQSNASLGNFSLRNSMSFGNASIFRSGRNEGPNAVPSDTKDPSVVEDPADGGRAGKRFKSSGSLDILRSQYFAGEKNTGRRKSFGLWGKSDAVNNLEQEMNTALGLSPTDTPSQAKDVAGTATSQTTPGVTQQFHGGITIDSGRNGPIDPATLEKSLPALPRGSEQPDAADMLGRPALETSDTASSIRPVTNDAVKPSTPSLGTLPPEVPPKDSPRELPLRNLSATNVTPSHPGHPQRQPSVSTLGVDERLASRPTEGEIETPPSPIQSETNTKGPDTPVYLTTLPETTESAASLASADENAPQFTAVYAKRQSSAQLLETKRRSVSGMPGIQSPLRNEVRYSPGKRTSMMSLSSFGRLSTIGRGTRPGTPANELSMRAAESNQPVQNGDSKMDKFKNFSKQRRRSSVGDLFAGLQENIQDGIQGLPEKSKRKRTFSRLSGLFKRSDESSQAKTNGQSSTFKILPRWPSNRRAPSSSAHQGQSNGSRHFTEKALPAMPALNSQPVSETIPPSGSGTGVAPSTFQHTRSQSQPITLTQPLSPTVPSTTERGSDSADKEPENPPSQTNQEEENEEILVLPSPTLTSHLQSLKSTSTQPDTPTLRTHQNRGTEVHSPNTTEPVEPATKDDSSEEIVMSSTTYPGQEWTPMHM